MIKADQGAFAGARMVRWGRAAAGFVAVGAGLNWVGWAVGLESWLLSLPSWSHTPQWTSALLAVLGAAILAQSGRPSATLLRLGSGLAVAAGVLTVIFLQTSLGDRPSPRSLIGVLSLSIAVALVPVKRRWAPALGTLCLAIVVASSLVTTLGYLFSAGQLSSTQSMGAAAGLVLLAVAALFTAPDRNPAAWLLARPDRRALARLVAVLGALPILVALSRWGLLTLGISAETERVLSIALATSVVGGVVFYFSQREQNLLIEKDRQRAEAETRYRLVADNAVDVVAYVRGTEVAWVSPSVQAAFGWPPEEWIGTDFSRRIHPDDLEVVWAALEKIARGESATVRTRVHTAGGGYRWVETRGKPSVDAEGNTDGMIFATRTIDEQVEAERQLERLAKFDTLTGALNRNETIARLESALEHPRSPGPYLGVLFCDVDHFKGVNDTWGHAVGDAVLTKVVDRIRESIRSGDTLGRTGGDEILVLLPGVHNMEETVRIAKKISCRVTEPIHQAEVTIHATLSIGVTVALPGEDALKVTARADAAMYEAKAAGRNAVATRAPDTFGVEPREPMDPGLPIR